MFTPGTRRKSSAVKDRNACHKTTSSSPFTPMIESRKLFDDDNPTIAGGGVIPNRPKTGTPAPWASRLSLLARIPTAKKTEKLDGKEPVHVGDFPQVVRDEQADFLRKSISGEACISGGMDQETALSWMICGSKLFIWCFLSPSASKNCLVLDLPSEVLCISSSHDYRGDTWLLSVLNWNNVDQSSGLQTQLTSAGVVLCNKKSRDIVFWPDIYDGSSPLVSLFASPEGLGTSPENAKSPRGRKQLNMRHGIIIPDSTSLNSLISSVIPSSDRVCVALATSANGELWQFTCSSSGVLRQRIIGGFFSSTSFSLSDRPSGTEGYPRSLSWRFPSILAGESKREFLLLTDHEIQCFSIQLSSNPNVSKLWSQEIIGTDNDLGIKKDLAGQKKIWPLDVQVAEHGKEIIILVAIFCEDRVSSSSYTQYSLLTMQYKTGADETAEGMTDGRVLEKKAPVQVIIPKARVEEEELLFSMRLRVGGKPSGSAVILSGDGVATVSYFRGNSCRLYQFDLPYDAGRVLDASVFPSTKEGDKGAWVVMTEIAGVWAIPEKAVLFGGVEPPLRSLSRKGSSNERSAEEEKANPFVGVNFSESGSIAAGDMAGRQRASFPGLKGRASQDEEAEALLSRLFHEYLLSGHVDGSLEKLNNAGAFERDGESNAFARASKSIVDTLAKHWTTTRGSEIVALTAVSNQLTEKLHKHEKFLLFLALSKCHEELSLKQRHALQIILEHGEKLTGMIQLRELQNMINHSRSLGATAQHFNPVKDVSGSLWDLIQLVGERTRRNTVLLMDRDNAEVFYSKISDIEEVFYCLDKHIDHLINAGQPLEVQVHRACELSKACLTLVRSAMQYKSEHHMWYPPPDGLSPWYSHSVVRDGLWSVASFMIRILHDLSGTDFSLKSAICSHLELLADVFLEAHVGAITAKIERGEEHKGLSDNYWKKRDILLDSLYQQIMFFANASCQDSVDENGEQREAILRDLSSNLLSVARRHEAYPTLWKICCDLNDSTLLKELMRESMGPRGGFSCYVFEQLYANKQCSKLLRLGEEFPRELMTFLKDHQELLWLHEIYVYQHSAASRTLHGLALSDGEVPISAANEEADSFSRKGELTLPERKHLLHLSKIAAAAGKDTGYEREVDRIDADLKILKSQEDILQLLPDDGEKQQVGQKLLPPSDLIRRCLRNRTPELLLRAFDVFAWTSSSFRASNKSLLEDCWRKTADQDDWEKLFHFSITEGWTEEDTLRSLEKTILFLAAKRCYGPESEFYGESFDEVLPLRRENEMLSNVQDSGGSVEAVLMQHKDYSLVGKLMLTAVMLGSAEVELGRDDRPVPME